MDKYCLFDKVFILNFFPEKSVSRFKILDLKAELCFFEIIFATVFFEKIYFGDINSPSATTRSGEGILVTALSIFFSFFVCLTMLGKVKEAIHNRVHPNNNNGDNEIEIPEAWMLMITKHNRRSVTKGTHEGTE